MLAISKKTTTYFSDEEWQFFSLTILNNENETDITQMLCSHLHQWSTVVTLLLFGVLADKSVQKSYQCEILQRITAVVNAVTLKQREKSHRSVPMYFFEDICHVTDFVPLIGTVLALLSSMQDGRVKSHVLKQFSKWLEGEVINRIMACVIHDWLMLTVAIFLAKTCTEGW